MCAHNSCIYICVIWFGSFSSFVYWIGTGDNTKITYAHFYIEHVYKQICCFLSIYFFSGRFIYNIYNQYNCWPWSLTNGIVYVCTYLCISFKCNIAHTIAICMSSYFELHFVSLFEQSVIFCWLVIDKKYCTFKPVSRTEMRIIVYCTLHLVKGTVCWYCLSNCKWRNLSSLCNQYKLQVIRWYTRIY